MDYHKQELYRSILKKLREPFPPGTIQLRNNSPHSQYIPAQAYEERLEEVAEMHWSWSIKGEPIIYERENEVQVIGTLKILDAKRDGIGFASFQRFPEGKIKNLKYAIRSAAQDALRDACDHFQMGWIDLGKGTNLKNTKKQDTRIHIEKSQPKIDICMICKTELSQKEIELLQENRIKLRYCREHLPKHLVNEGVNR
ncbi:hypothetical protein [Desertibacillus haloalkaliphilus]|uniref:hypothetical protein n=1 Tax=Desertibacillus haloalkaliphilus TaxID=1328930 RepID=UPI001C25CEB4|nr:hypothetical protein [Desertibacillus haloalkaliphilus]MBU8908268.1 hypothetical protein [Desertibacillus haloalkaliphilus]